MSLINYAQTGNIEEIRKMIKNGKLKKEDILRSEMKYNNNQTALFWASCRGHLEIVKLFITALCSGNLHCVVPLMRSGSKEYIMMKDKDGKTALYWASSNDHLEIIKLLIKEGNLQKEDILHSGSVLHNNNGETAYSVANKSIKQLFNNVLFNGDINDMIKDIMVTA